VEWHHIVEAAGIVSIGLVFYSHACRWFTPPARLQPRWRALVMGLAFGVLTVVLMIARIEVAPGVWIDARAVPVALVTLVEGWPAGALAALCGAAYRASRGGAGAPAGVVGLAGTVAAAWLVAAWARRDGRVRLHHVLALGAAAFLMTFASFLMLGTSGLTMFWPRAVPSLLMNVIGIGIGARLFLDVAQSAVGEAARREAAEMRAVTLLARAAAHEINNPLTIVTGGLQLLGRRLPANSEDAQWIARAAEGAGRIKDIVTRMNEITRIEEEPPRGLLPPMLDIRKSSEPR
jgi:signal transduction histidine kinase